MLFVHSSERGSVPAAPLTGLIITFSCVTLPEWSTLVILILYYGILQHSYPINKSTLGHVPFA